MVEIRRFWHVTLRGKGSIWNTFVLEIAVFCIGSDVASLFRAILSGKHGLVMSKVTTL